MSEILISEAPKKGAPIINLSAWLGQVGVTAVTAWRWRKKGWLRTINICGRQYLSQEAIDEFMARAQRGEFAQEHKVPTRKGGAL
jgi:predicted site-specific integrase-resolvase